MNKKLFLLVLLLPFLIAFTYSAPGDNGFATGESVAAAHMNELDTALDAIEADLLNEAGLQTQLGSVNIILATEIDTSAELLAIVTNETGTGALTFATSPTLVTPALGTPSALVLTNATGSLALGNGTVTASTPTEFASASTINTGLTEAELGGKWFYVTSGTDVITLPEITATGHSACFYAVTTAIITLDVDATDEFVLNGAPGAAGVTITSPAAGGSYVCLMSREVGGNDQWYTLGQAGTWLVGT